MSTNSLDRKLTYKELIGVPLAGFGPTLQTCLQMYFLLYFFTNVLGISGTAAAIIIMVARIWDFINDPLMAVLVQKSKKPEKCLFWMKAAIIPLVVFWVLTYTAPNLSSGAKVVWAAVMFIGLGMSQTAYSIPLSTLRPSLTTDGVERNRLNRAESIFSLVANILIPAVTMPLVAILQGYNVSAPFMVLAAMYSVVYLITALAGIRLLKGHDHSTEFEQASSRGSSASVGQMVSALFANKVALMVLVAQVVKYLISSTAGSAMVYYFTYNIQNEYAMSLASSIGGIVGIVPVLFLPTLYKKFGNAGTALLGAVIGVAAMGVRFATHDASLMIVYSMAALEAIGVELSTCMLMQCLMDSLEYGEWKTGKKNTAVIMSAYGIGTKIGLAFGSTIAGIVIDAVSFDPNVLEQSQSVLNAFFNLNITLPMLMYVALGLLFVYLWKIEKKLPQMRAEIEAGTNPGAAKN